MSILVETAVVILFLLVSQEAAANLGSGNICADEEVRHI